ncbi:hypothetical protein HZH68_002234 [Vespula germanica]|uniref:BPTI/Kunitz inhibitor domain-containing protein n=1 Tax=Vespula germanica TaxID=30212 RepID=A0A834NKS5_VESGE|nr:hypothetical protein HZH68_002234 [Vespula germanica]
MNRLSEFPTVSKLKAPSVVNYKRSFAAVYISKKITSSDNNLTINKSQFGDCIRGLHIYQIVSHQIRKRIKMKTKILILCLFFICSLVYENSAHHTVCHHPIAVGPCKAAIPRWAYDGSKCVDFIYGGCQGNPNNFISKVECEAACAENN